MPEDNGVRANAQAPSSNFSFEVDFGMGLKGRFEEVSGLDAEARPSESADGDSNVVPTHRLPGVFREGNVSMKRGIFANDDAVRTWINDIRLNAVSRRTVSVRLLDGNGHVAMQWTLSNALPTVVFIPETLPEGNALTVHSIHLVYQRIEVSNG